MGAGKHDGIGAPAVGLDEAGRDLDGDLAVCHGRALQIGLRQAGELGRADQRDVAAIGEVANERVGVFA